MKRPSPLVLAAVAVLTSLCVPLVSRSEDSPGGRVATVAAAFVRESERRDPLFADQIGIHTREDTLADYSLTGQADRARWLRAWRVRIAAVAGGRLTQEERADASALLDVVDLELFEGATVKPLRTDPTVYTGVIGQAVYSLIGRHYAPPDDRLRHLAPRLRQIPAIVSAAEASLEGAHPCSLHGWVSVEGGAR